MHILRLGLTFCAVLSLAYSLSLNFVEKGAMPTGGLSHMASVVVSTKIYFFGGMVTTTDDYFGSSGAYSYDIATDKWTNLTSMGYTRYGMCAATDGEKIWVFGGYDGRDNTYKSSIYTIASNTWQLTTDSETYMFGCSAAYFADTGKVLIMYGYAPALTYDPVADKYEALPYPYNRLVYGAGSVAFNDKLWLSSYSDDLTAFRTVTSDGLTWENKTSNPNGLVFAGLVQIYDVMLTFGGSDDSGEVGLSFDRINMYNITTETWTTLDVTLPISLQGATAALIGPSIYLFGGLSNPSGSDPSFPNKYWVVPCINPDVCQLGCDPSGACVAPPQSEPIAVPESVAPMTAPVASPQASPVSAPVKAPTSRLSGAVANQWSLVLFFALALCVVLA